MTQPNWFLAFPVPGDFVRELPPLPRGFRLFAPEDVHLTLCFLGGCGQAAAERALATLDAQLTAAPESNLSVSLKTVVPMGAPRAYTALSALLGSGNDAAAGALTRLRDAPLQAATGRIDRRPAKPHVTVARPLRASSTDERQAGLVWAGGLNLEHVSAVLDRIALYTWDQHRAKRLFRIVAERRLSLP